MPTRQIIEIAEELYDFETPERCIPYVISSDGRRAETICGWVNPVLYINAIAGGDQSVRY